MLPLLAALSYTYSCHHVRVLVNSIKLHNNCSVWSRSRVTATTSRIPTDHCACFWEKYQRTTMSQKWHSTVAPFLGTRGTAVCTQEGISQFVKDARRKNNLLQRKTSPEAICSKYNSSRLFFAYVCRKTLLFVPKLQYEKRKKKICVRAEKVLHCAQNQSRAQLQLLSC